MSLDEMDALMSASSAVDGHQARRFSSSTHPDSDPFADIDIDSSVDPVKYAPGSRALPVPMSPAQRFKRDRTLSSSRPQIIEQSLSFGSLVGSELGHPAQR